MHVDRANESIRQQLLALGLAASAVSDWSEANERWLEHGGDWQAAGALLSRATAAGRALLQSLPARSRRSPDQTAAADALRVRLVNTARSYCRGHARALYDNACARINGIARLEALAEAAAELLPDVFPSRRQLTDEARALQKDKDGLELFQGALFAEWFDDPVIGMRLIADMQRPLPGLEESLTRLRRHGELDLDKVLVRVDGRLGSIEFNYSQTLNAEDETSLPPFEQAIDLLLLHPEVQMGVLRGGRVQHPKYANRRLFSAGINLTALYRGEQSFLWYLIRELGPLNKIYRGLLTAPGAFGGESNTREMPWIAVVDGFAIGGGCQILLVVDHVLAERGAYFNLPARKEGIIPGCANLRLPNFLGLRASQAAILFGREFMVEEPLSAGLVNAVHATEELDSKVAEVASLALDSGMVSAAGNRRALRCIRESPDDFRRYMALYSWEQAWCHLSPQLADNLERHWKKAQAD